LLLGWSDAVTFDVAIIGGGPAGATLARLIGGKLRTLLLERRGLDKDPDERAFEKCCGGLLAPDAQKVLGKMGLSLPKNVLVDPQLFVVRAIDLPSGMERTYQRFYTNMDRERFDRWLVSLVPHMVDSRFDSRFVSAEKEDDCIRVRFLQKGKENTVRTKVLIGSDGAMSNVRRQFFPSSDFPKTYFSVQEWLEVKESPPYFSVFFDPELTDFYAWMIPKEDNLLIGIPTRKGVKASEKLVQLKQKLQALGIPIGKTQKRRGAFIHRPSSVSQLCLGGGNVGLIGEAAGWISPSSAEGLSYAFRSALAMSEAMRHGLEDFLDLYRQGTSSLRRNIWIKNLKVNFLYIPGFRRLVMRCGFGSLEVHEPEGTYKLPL
jgi:flavin-dependent dehydrogenase